MGNCCYGQSDTEFEGKLHKRLHRLHTTNPATSRRLSRGCIPITQEDLSLRYRILSAIGRGTYSTVYKALNLSSGQYFAIKSVKKEHIYDSGLWEDIRTMQLIQHPSVLKIYEVIEDVDSFNMVSELCSGGDLLSKIASLSYFSENKAALYMGEIMEAVEFYHSKGIVNSSLCPATILFLNDDVNSPLKIVKFAESRKDNSMSTDFQAPEGEISDKSEIWRCGKIMLTMLIGSIPYNNDYFINWKVSLKARFLIDRMLSNEPAQRPTAEEVSLDEWVRKKDTVDHFIDIELLKNMYQRKSKDNNNSARCTIHQTRGFHVNKYRDENTNEDDGKTQIDRRIKKFRNFRLE